MRKRGVLALFGLAGAAGVLLATSSRRDTSPGGGGVSPSPLKRVLLVGDSFAVGLNSPLRALAQASGIPFEGHGAEGSRIDQWAANATIDVPKRGKVALDLDTYLSTFRPSHVLVSLGANDEAASADFVASEPPKVAALLSKIVRSGAAVLWIGPPSLPYARKGAADMAVRGVAALGAPNRYLPSEVLTIPRSPADKQHLHPTSGGYASWAKAIWDWASSGHDYVLAS